MHLLARIAGASASFLDAFDHPSLRETSADWLRCRVEIDALRERLVDVLYALVSRDDPDERRFLLSLKRDAFNGRGILRRRRHELWESANAQTDGLLESLAAEEERLAELRTRIEDAFDQAVDRERRALLDFGEDLEFRRGLALASPLVARARARYAGRSGRRAAAMEKSLLRYAVRTVTKISPYSTLTPVTLASALAGSARAIRFRPEERRIDSTVRVKRHLLDPVCRRLFRRPGPAAAATVGLNPSLEILEGGRCRFLQPRSASGEGTGGSGARLVTVELEGPWFDRLCERLGGGASVGLVELPGLMGDPEEEAEHAELVQTLLELGLLEVRPPWPGYAPRLELELWRFLSEVERARGDEGPSLQPMVDGLAELLEEEDGFCRRPDPESAAERFPRRVGELHRAVARYTGTEDRPFPRRDVRGVYEDVVISTADGGAVLELSTESLRRAQRSVDPLWRASALFSPFHEVRAVLSTWIGERYGKEARVGLPRLFAESRKLWRAATPRLRGAVAEPFDPHGSPFVAELERLRGLVRRETAAAFQAVDGDPGTVRLEAGAARRILELVPEPWRSPVPPALCLQPLDAAGSSWVANEIFAGVGRMSSRFTSVLPPEQGDLLVESALERGAVDFAGQRFELLDLLFTKGNTVNVHRPQTRRVFLGPGETADLPPERILRPGDLSVRRREDGELLLVGPSDEPLLPVFLSPMSDTYLPQLWQLMLLFGVPGAALHLPAPLLGSGEEVETRPRMMVEDLVVARRRWRIAADRLRVPEGSEAERFRAWNEWRSGLGLPRRVYVLEKVAGDEVVGSRFKPQFVDFGSPSLTALWGEAVGEGEDLVLFEALPAPDGYPLDPGIGGGGRAVEVVVDLGLG